MISRLDAPGAAEPPDEGEIGRHHRELRQLRQRHRRGKADGLGELARQIAALRARSVVIGNPVCLVDGGHGTIIASCVTERWSLEWTRDGLRSRGAIASG